jgi:hypothetical protein
MKSLYVLYDRLMRLDVSHTEARATCHDAECQIHSKGRFAVEACGGWIFGTLTPHGVRLGR